MQAAAYPLPALDSHNSNYLMLIDAGKTTTERLPRVKDNAWTAVQVFDWTFIVLTWRS